MRKRYINPRLPLPLPLPLPFLSYRRLLFKLWTLCVLSPLQGAQGQRTMFILGSLEST